MHLRTNRNLLLLRLCSIQKILIIILTRIIITFLRIMGSIGLIRRTTMNGSPADLGFTPPSVNYPIEVCEWSWLTYPGIFVLLV